MLMRRTALILFSALFIAAGALAQEPTTFDQLSPGNQKIAKAIEAAQPEVAPVGKTLMTSGEIAQLKQDGMGWGEIFKHMQAENLTTFKNLGQAVSSYQHSISPGSHGISPGSEVVVTTGSGQRITVGGKKKGFAATTSSANGKTKSKGHKGGASKGVHVTTAGGGQGPVSTGKGAGKTHVTTGNGSSSSGIVTGAGASSSGVIHGGGGGNAYGHAKAGKNK